jgi:hypothetical protein
MCSSSDDGFLVSTNTIANNNTAVLDRFGQLEMMSDWWTVSMTNFVGVKRNTLNDEEVVPLALRIKNRTRKFALKISRIRANGYLANGGSGGGAGQWLAPGCNRSLVQFKVRDWRKQWHPWSFLKVLIFLHALSFCPHQAVVARSFPLPWAEHDEAESVALVLSLTGPGIVVAVLLAFISVCCVYFSLLFPSRAAFERLTSQPKCLHLGLGSDSVG